MDDPTFAIDWTIVAKLMLAVVIVLPLAWHAELKGGTAGLRTFPLVSVGACGYILVSQAVIGPDQPEAIARILEGLITGIGFVGGGAILKSETSVKGTSIAASIWVTGALGASVGFGLWELAAVLAAFNLGIVMLFGIIEEKLLKRYRRKE